MHKTRNRQCVYWTSRRGLLKIVCLGWGSLIWCPRELRLREKSRPWHRDGPELRVEFARQLGNGRMTIVLFGGGSRCRTLWAELSCENVGEARDNLRHREETSGSNIRSWVRGSSIDDETAGKVALWATEKSVDAVVWTALGPKFSGEPRAPTQGEAVSYLSSLDGETREMAEEYVRRAPEQIVTQYRIAIASSLGWKYDGAKTDPNLC